MSKDVKNEDILIGYLKRHADKRYTKDALLKGTRIVDRFGADRILHSLASQNKISKVAVKAKDGNYVYAYRIHSASGSEKVVF